MARILHCCGRGIGQQLQFRLDPGPRKVLMPRVQPLKKKRKEKQKTEDSSLPGCGGVLPGQAGLGRCLDRKKGCIRKQVIKRRSARKRGEVGHGSEEGRASMRACRGTELAR